MGGRRRVATRAESAAPAPLWGVSCPGSRGWAGLSLRRRPGWRWRLPEQLTPCGRVRMTPRVTGERPRREM